MDEITIGESGSVTPSDASTTSQDIVTESGFLTPSDASTTSQDIVTEYITIGESRPFLTTPLDDYNVTEGMLFLIVAFLFGILIFKIINR
jgi:hypothetical protein